MGSGTISFKKLPSKKKVYGDREFFIRPKMMYYVRPEGEALCFLIRKEVDEELVSQGYKYQIEGEFGMGQETLKEERKEARGKNVYYQVFPYDFKAEFDILKENLSKEEYKSILDSLNLGVRTPISRFKDKKVKEAMKTLNQVYSFSEFNYMFPLKEDSDFS